MCYFPKGPQKWIHDELVQAQELRVLRSSLEIFSLSFARTMALYFQPETLNPKPQPQDTTSCGGRGLAVSGSGLSFRSRSQVRIGGLLEFQASGWWALSVLLCHSWVTFLHFYGYLKPIRNIN